jgi:short subunit dehydrogenase-like uncharacterized protein
VPSWLLYGANGYTGRLIAREAVARGLPPILAGRDAPAVGSLAAELGLAHRAFPLTDAEALRAGLEGVDLVLHAAGPFVRTSRPMVKACLATGSHYLDITGEIPVFELVLAQDAEAKAAGVVLLPGVGFDVVPTDCLAARLAAALPAAESLELAFCHRRAGLSPGTLKTMIEGLPRAGAERRGGRIVALPAAHDAREIPFSCGPRWAMTIPWGDVSTAFHTTGIPNIRVYSAASPRAIRRLRRLAPLLPLLGRRWVKRRLQAWVGRRVPGPDEEARRTGRVYLWGRASAPDGTAVTATLETPEGYTLTALSAVECVRRVLGGQPGPGAWTPGRAFGPELVAGLPGVVVGDPRR